MTTRKKPHTTETFAEHFEAMRRTAGYAVEYLKLEISESIYRHMEKSGMSRADLAARIGRSAGYVTKLYRTELPVESLARVADELGLVIDFEQRKPDAATSATSETYKCESCGKQYRDEQLLTHRCTKGAKR